MPPRRPTSASTPSRPPAAPGAGTAGLPVRTQISAGGVVVRAHEGELHVALIRVGVPGRWQLPKGLVGPGESQEATALRETREEAGVDAELIAPLDTVEYWYVGDYGWGAARERVRFHKFVHFFLLAYRSGDVREHDHEVEEAAWVPLAEAGTRLAFRGERAVLARAAELLAGGDAARQVAQLQDS